MKKKDDSKFDIKLNRVVYAILAVLLLIGGTAIFVYHAQQNDPESSEYADSVTDDSSDESSEDDSTDNDLDDESESSEESSTDDSNINQVVSMIQKNFKDKATVSYDEDSKAILIIPTDEEFTDEVVDVANGDGDEDAWNGLTKSINDVSSEMVDKFGAKVGLAIVNPQNHDKVLYEALDGNTVYDVVTDGSEE